MRRVRKFLIPLLLLSPVFGYAAQPDSLLPAAEAAFLEGKYEVASALWEQVIDAGIESADIYYNLGNAYFKVEELPKAILCWERSLKLDPSHADAKYNLKLAATMLDDKIDPLPGFFLVNWFHASVRLLAFTTWAWIALALVLLATLGFLFYRLVRSPLTRRIAFYTATVLVFLSISSLILSWQGRKILHDDSAAIIFSPTVIVKSSPDARGTDIFVIHAGTKVRIKDSLQGWYRIRIADGNEGWVASAVLERI